jgi:hypothetical protein
MDHLSSLTQHRLKQVVSYDPSTGIFRRLASNNQYRAGKNSGWVEREYVRITIDGSHYMAHRLAWLYVYGKWPIVEVDHINGDRGDNRIDNLRLASDQLNAFNRRVNSNNVLGVKGVRFHECGKYTARINKDGKLYYLGVFDTLEQAVAVRRAKEMEFFGEFAP